MAKGISLHIGLNSVNPNSYAGWDGKLNACEADANDMQALVNSRGFKSNKLLTAKATRAAVAAGISDAAKKLVLGDMFLLTYSGHGGQLPDQNGDEIDGKDETWVLYDSEMVDDELYAAWSQFKAGVRILVLSDSCHSGTVVRDVMLRAGPGEFQHSAYRAMPSDIALRTYEANRKFYDPILQNRDLIKAAEAVKASVLLISGCADNQLSSDGTFNGLFTGTLKSVWNGGTFKGSYRQFHKAILQKMPSDQSPELLIIGAANKVFLGSEPFKI